MTREEVETTVAQLKPFYAFMDACSPKDGVELSGAVSVSYERVKTYVAAAVDAERDRVLYVVRDVAGIEVALKVALATAPER